MWITGRSLHITRKGSYYYESGLAIPFRLEAAACSASLPGRVKGILIAHPVKGSDSARKRRRNSILHTLMIKSILSGYGGGKEEVPQAYLSYAEEIDDATNKGSRIKAA